MKDSTKVSSLQKIYASLLVLNEKILLSHSFPINAVQKCKLGCLIDTVNWKMSNKFVANAVISIISENSWEKWICEMFIFFICQ